MVVVQPPTPSNLARAAALLRAGGLVAFPTETVYGLGAAARQPAAVGLVFEAKGRPRDHPLIVHLPDAAHLERWAASVPAEAHELARRFWPGPLTIVLQRAAEVPAAVTGGQATVALRVPGHPVALGLLSQFGDGVAAPSANRFGRISPTSAAHVAEEFAGADLFVLDGGPSRVGVESTILDLTPLAAGTLPRLLRPGGVGVAALEEALQAQVLLPGQGREDELGEGERGEDAPRVPGSLSSHYAAAAPTRLVEPGELERVALASPGAAVLALRPAPAAFEGAWSALPAEPDGYAQRLYAELRRLDAHGPSVILVERVPEGPTWLAVRDRLMRAAAG